MKFVRVLKNQRMLSIDPKQPCMPLLWSIMAVHLIQIKEICCILSKCQCNYLRFLVCLGRGCQSLMLSLQWARVVELSGKSTIKLRLWVLLARNSTMAKLDSLDSCQPCLFCRVGSLDYRKRSQSLSPDYHSNRLMWLYGGWWCYKFVVVHEIDLCQM